MSTLSGHGDTVLSVCFSPDGKQIASGSSDKTIKIWNASIWVAETNKTDPKKKPSATPAKKADPKKKPAATPAKKTDPKKPAAAPAKKADPKRAAEYLCIVGATRRGGVKPKVKINGEYAKTDYMVNRRAVYVKVVGSRKGKMGVWYDGKGKWRCGKIKDVGTKKGDAQLESEAASPEESVASDNVWKVKGGGKWRKQEGMMLTGTHPKDEDEEEEEEGSDEEEGAGEEEGSDEEEDGNKCLLLFKCYVSWSPSRILNVLCTPSFACVYLTSDLRTNCS